MPSISASLEAFENNSDFRNYARKMMADGHTFPSAKKYNGKMKTAVLITHDDAQTRNAWMDCCFRDYIHHKKMSGASYIDSKFIYIRFLFIASVVSILLACIWPIWSFLIDVDIKSYHNILGLEHGADPTAVTKAYRKQIKLWHPDSNPNCGAYCRTQTEKIQQAYEVLLDRKRYRSFLDNQYLNGLLQLRSLFFFRMYSLSSNAAHEMSNLLFHSCGQNFRDDWRLRLTLFCHLVTLILFISHEIFVVSGFDIILLFQVFFFVVNKLRSSAREKVMMDNKLSSYTDIFSEALWMIGFPVSLNLLYIAFHMDSLSLIKELLRVALGFLYVISYLGKFTPNLYSNMKEKTFKVSLCYQNQGGRPASEFILFIQTELAFLVDDLFIFTCRVPSIYRMVVFASHTFYLLQYSFFTREFPQLGSKNEHEGNASNEDCANSKKKMSQNQGTAVHQELSETDAKLLTKLDQDSTCWLDVPRSKYNYVMLMMIAKLVEHGGNNIIVDFTCTSDMENIAFFLLDTKTHLKSGTLLIRDPPMARLIGLECGPFQSAPCTDKERLDVKCLQESCLRSLGPEANLTASEVWCMRKYIPLTGAPVPQSAFESLFFGVLFCLLLLTVCFFTKISPAPIDLFDSLTYLPPSMQPLRVSRFSNILRREHILNRANSGLFTFWNSSFVLCTVDFWDSYRQLLFYTTS